MAQHKYDDGWIFDSETFTAEPGQVHEVTLAPANSPTPPSDGYLWARVPIRGSPHRLYSVEFRPSVGYDWLVPGGVVIHKINASWRERATVQLPDNEKRAWQSGEVFTDPAEGISIEIVKVDSQDSATVRLESPPASPPPNDDVSDAIDMTYPKFEWSAETSLATGSPSDPWCADGHQSVWFVLDSPVEGWLDVTTWGSSYSTNIGVYAGSIEAPEDHVCAYHYAEHANEDTDGLQGFRVHSGTRYFVSIASSLDEGGELSVQSHVETVVLDRRMTLHLSFHLRARGRIWPDPYVVQDLSEECVVDRKVKLKRKTRRGWKKISRTKTNDSGIFRFRAPDRPGRYKAVAPKQDRGTHICARTVSPLKKHRH